MNDSCFKVQKDKAKQEFVKFPDNMDSQIIFMNIIKQYKITLHLSEKAFNPISTGGRCFPRKFCLPVDNFFSFGSIATKFGDFS